MLILVGCDCRVRSVVRWPSVGVDIWLVHADKINLAMSGDDANEDVPIMSHV